MTQRRALADETRPPCYVSGTSAVARCCEQPALSEVTRIRSVAAFVNATFSSTPSISAITVRCLPFFRQVVQHLSDRGPFVTFEVCSQLVSMLLKSLLQLPHPVALVLRLVIEFLELVVDVGPVSHCGLQLPLEMLDTSTAGVASASCFLQTVADQGVQLVHLVFHVLLRCELRFKLLSFDLKVRKPRHARVTALSHEILQVLSVGLETLHGTCKSQTEGKPDLDASTSSDSKMDSLTAHVDADIESRAAQWQELHGRAPEGIGRRPCKHGGGASHRREQEIGCLLV